MSPAVGDVKDELREDHVGPERLPVPKLREAQTVEDEVVHASKEDALKGSHEEASEGHRAVRQGVARRLPLLEEREHEGEAPAGGEESRGQHVVEESTDDVEGVLGEEE